MIPIPHGNNLTSNRQFPRSPGSMPIENVAYRASQRPPSTARAPPSENRGDFGRIKKVALRALCPCGLRPPEGGDPSSPPGSPPFNPPPGQPANCPSHGRTNDGYRPRSKTKPRTAALSRRTGRVDQADHLCYKLIDQRRSTPGRSASSGTTDRLPPEWVIGFAGIRTGSDIPSRTMSEAKVCRRR